MPTRRVPLLLALLVSACVDTPPPPQAPVELATPFLVAITGVDRDGVSFEIVNGRDVEADVTVRTNVASSAGLTRGPAVRLERLAPLERRALTVPRAEVPAFAATAQLSVTAEVQFDDDERRNPTSAPYPIVADGSIWRAGDPDVSIVSLTPAIDVTGPIAELTATRRLCLRVATDYDDTGIGEDFWTNNGPTFRTIRGADVEVFHDGTSFTGRLADGIDGSHAGCIDITNRGIDNGDWLTIKVFSSGRVNGHTVRVEHESSGARATASVTVSYASMTEAWFDLTPSTSTLDRFNIYMAATYSMFRHGGTADSTVTIHEWATGVTRSDASNIYINATDGHEKFKIAREVGHYIARKSGAEIGNDRVCDDYRTADLGPCDKADFHSLTSKEYVRCAASEGFADFYAADVFNDHDETECWIKLDGSPAVDCQVGSPGFPQAMMESVCDAPYPGYGVETDWMRVFWDVHTRGSNVPSMSDVLRWIAASDNHGEAWSNTNAYDLLNAEASRRNDNLTTNWTDVKDTHGIDHPTE
jgi:hypothetical protein